jgi:hypothetical protein
MKQQATSRKPQGGESSAEVHECGSEEEKGTTNCFFFSRTNRTN